MISVKEMRELEEKCGISSKLLMENAGKGVCDIIRKRYDIESKKVLVVCYHGNNGGDGFVAARYLSKICQVDVLFLGNEEKLSNEARENFERIKGKVRTAADFNSYDFIIDAMLGTGIRGKLNKPLSEAVDSINSSDAVKIAVDVPTGLDPDTGEVSDRMVEADLIVTFHDVKRGLKDFIEKVVVKDIGISRRSSS